jgi:cell wall-associated NlpC family hydrolase
MRFAIRSTTRTMRIASARARTALAAAAVACCLALPAGAQAWTPTLGNWDRSQQFQVLRARLMGNVGRSFMGASPVTVAQANAAMAALGARLAAAGVSTPRPVRTHKSPVTVTTFDAMVVDQLGLRSVAAQLQSVARAAGLLPPSYFGTEVAARFLGLRYDHPAGTDQLELFPDDAITRAEAAWSLSQVLGFGSWDVSYAQQTLSSFQLPPMTANQLQAMQVAISRIGYPYVYAGTTDDTSDGLAHGGFDCSGFVWRVFKISGLPWGNQIRGRTAAQMAGEIPRSQRLRMSQLQPGDILFFGSAHFTSPATEQDITHTGIYLGDNWVIHASGQGVNVDQLKGGWLGSSFAWGRRVIH